MVAGRKPMGISAVSKDPPTHRLCLLHPQAQARRHLRRPRGRLGPPQGRRAGGERRAVLRLLPLPGHHGRRAGWGHSSQSASGELTSSGWTTTRCRPWWGCSCPCPKRGSPSAADRRPGIFPPGPRALRHSAADRSLVMDLHPHDRASQGAHQGATLWNGGCYCPATPKALFDLEPLSRGRATPRSPPRTSASRSWRATSSQRCAVPSGPSGKPKWTMPGDG
jgi:hypothetical protein